MFYYKKNQLNIKEEDNESNKGPKSIRHVENKIAKWLFSSLPVVTLNVS